MSILLQATTHTTVITSATIRGNQQSLESFFAEQSAAIPRITKLYDKCLDEFAWILEEFCQETYWVVEDVEFLTDEFVVQYQFSTTNDEDIDNFLADTEKKTGHPILDMTETEGTLTVSYSPF